MNDYTQISLEHLLERVALLVADHPLYYLFVLKRNLPVRITSKSQLIAFIRLFDVLLREIVTLASTGVVTVQLLFGFQRD